jgi:gliding motility-associated-like protein
MKKITLLLITILFSFTGYSQALIQGFEAPTVPPAVPLNWARFESGSASEIWFTSTSSPRTGTKSALLYGENLGVGGIAKYYIATPLVTIPLNGQLRFWVKTSVQGNQGGVFKIKVASGALAANQTTEAAYTTTLQTYTESQLSTNVAPAPIVYEEQVVDFPPATFPAGTQIYIAFVSEVNQTSPFQGDDFFLDDVLVVSRCLEPNTLATGIITSASAVLNWTNPNPLTGAGLNTCNQWEIEIIPTTQLAPIGSGIIVNTNPFTATTLTVAPFAPLLSLTQYKYYVRSICAFSGSIWAGPFPFTTAPGPAVCGGNYVDVGGLTANYNNSTTAATGTTTICPVTAGDLVTVTFTSFATEISLDLLKVYNGNSATGTLLGTFSGTLTGANLPGPFTSTDPSGCLTFVFTSDNTVTAAGWLANITCAPIPPCTRTTALTTSAITSTSVSLGWTQPINPNGTTGTAWEYLALACGTAAPTATTTGFLPAPTNPFVVTGLIPGKCYDFYVRAVCNPTQSSVWSLPISATTLPGCGGFFVDAGGISANYANSLNLTTEICPVNIGDQVTVTFTSFSTQLNTDILTVYDGVVSPANLIGAYSGTVIPAPITATGPTGCLTFVFTSNATTNSTGWISNVTCAPAPTCTKPKNLTVTQITQSTALLGWTQQPNPDGSVATAWQVCVVPCGSAVPPIGSASWVNANSNPFYITGLNSATCYDYYVRAICSPTDSSSIVGPKSFNTLIVNDECTGAIEIPVNQNTNCLQTAFGSLTFATGSIDPNSCGGTIDDDDVWFKFTATSTSHYITILGPNYTAAPFNINYVLYTGSCGVLTQFGTCITANVNTATGLTVGQTYYVRVYSTGSTPVTTTFEICVGTNVGTCATALPLCAITPIIIPNNVGVPTLPNPVSPFSLTSPTVGCLGTAPSPTFYYLQIPANGNYNFFLEQNTSSAFTGTGIDVDFVAWGPYATTAAACVGISTTNAPATGISCSFSAAFTENFGVNGAIAGEIYLIMITNYSGRKGFVRITQTAGPIPTVCCPFGNFTYAKSFYCQNEANPSPILISNAVAGTYSSTAGLSLNPLTGLINLAASIPGTYVIHNSISASGTCPADDDTWTLTITAPPTSVAITYSAPSYCKFDTTIQNSTQTGTLGGNYTVSPAVGLSLNTVTGSFTPSTSTVGTYIVSYNLPQVGGCPGAISSTTVSIILPVPTFTPAPPICAGGTSAPLPTTSLNGIMGSWSPAINNSVTTTYTFTPDAGQCASTTTMTIQVGIVAPVFTQVAPICSGTPLSALPTISSNGVTGTWSPVINNTATTTYTFTPVAGFCSSVATMTIVVSPPSLTPTFRAITPICNGATLAALPTTSINGVIGVWSPAINNLATTTYTFTPNPAQCAVATTLIIIVNPILGVTVNSPTVCSSTTATVTATPTLPGTYAYSWTVPTGATNPGNVASFTASVSGAYSLVITQVNSFCNSDFESPLGIPLGTMALVNQSNFQCWRTTATDGMIEVWTNGNENTNAYSGTQFIELNANQVSTLYQDLSVIPGSSVNISFAHRGRFSGTDVMRVEIGPVGGPYVSLGNFSATPSAWVYNSLNYTFPNNGVINYTIRFVSVTSGSGNLTVGNFIDAVSITGLGCSSLPVTGNVLITTVRTPTFTQIPTLCQNSVAPVLPTSSTNTNPVTGTWNSAISTSTIGSTTFTFTPAANQCATSTTMSVTVAASLVATFNYNSATYCKTGANPTLSFVNGGSAGVFTSTAGLSLNSSTGAIDLSTSTLGNYTITNTIAASSACQGVIATFAITITAAPIATFNYVGTPYCKNGTNPTPTFTGGGVAGTFTSTTGLTINSSTGVITLANSTAGTYTVTNTIAAANGCALLQSTAQVTITTLPVATFSYNDTFYCKTGANPVITLTGAAGVFSSTTGLTLNSTTGAIDLSTSTPGNYTITNTIAAAAGCSGVSATFAITITAPQLATFSYTATPYCKNAANPNPTFSGGGVAGTFTSTSGLTINSSTGVINLASSTAGTYTVSNTLAATGGCPQVVATTQVTITTLPVATFSYNAATYCKTGVNPVITLTGAAGVFSSTTGLTLNSTTGAINLSTSTSGNYTITNTIVAAAGCSVVSATFAITITDPLVATFSYTSSPYCKNGINPNPTFSGGGVAGTFTSTIGLSINATSGAINLASSTAGTYTVTNTIAATGGCISVIATTLVTITNLPQATIAYSDAFYCYNNTGTQTVTLIGTTGGTFTASPAGLSISSTSGAFNVSLSPAGSYTVSYTMAASAGCPQVIATTTFTIIPQINVELRAVCNGPDFTITALPVAGSFNPVNATYEWSGPNGFIFGPTSNPSIVITTPGLYVSTVIYNGCRYLTTQQVDGITCTIQKGISPNGDGDNEAFILSDVKALSIFNRYGIKVYSHAENYTNQWHGQSESGSELPDGTYYYVITRNSGSSITGWIYINR